MHIALLIFAYLMNLMILDDTLGVFPLPSRLPSRYILFMNIYLDKWKPSHQGVHQGSVIYCLFEDETKARDYQVKTF